MDEFDPIEEGTPENTDNTLHGEDEAYLTDEEVAELLAEVTADGE
jgi:hypothetical protein